MRALPRALSHRGNSPAVFAGNVRGSARGRSPKMHWLRCLPSNLPNNSSKGDPDRPARGNFLIQAGALVVRIQSRSAGPGHRLVVKLGKCIHFEHLAKELSSSGGRWPRAPAAFCRNCRAEQNQANYQATNRDVRCQPPNARLVLGEADVNLQNSILARNEDAIRCPHRSPNDMRLCIHKAAS